MSNITQLTAVPADLIGAQAVSTPTPQATTTAGSSNPDAQSSASADPSQPAKPADSSQRLIISQGANKGVYVYTILDRATGAVLVQIPHEEVMHIATRPDYSAGAVVDTKI